MYATIICVEFSIQSTSFILQMSRYSTLCEPDDFLAVFLCIVFFINTLARLNFAIFVVSPAICHFVELTWFH